MPTVTPTKPPTNECINFHFCWCCTISCGDSIDVLMIVDGSSSIPSDSFTDFMGSLADGMKQFWPTDGESKFGLVMFASTVETEGRIPIDIREVYHDCHGDYPDNYNADDCDTDSPERIPSHYELI